MTTPVYHKLFLGIAILSMILSACGPTTSASIAESDLARDTAPGTLPKDIQTLVQNNNDFAFDLYQSLRGQGGNLIYSPYSISLALAMTYAGARGETESQMARALHFLPQEQIHPAFNALDLQLAERGKDQSKAEKPLQLSIVNAIWAEQTYPFEKSFLDTIATNYGAGIRLVDFIDQYEPVRREINRWVSDQTQDKIKDLLPAGVLDSNTRMALINAIYFKAAWLEPFNPYSTRDAPFHLLDGSEINVPTMNQTIVIPYAKDDRWQAIELTYRGDTASMVIVVPDKGRFAEVEASLDAETMSTILRDLKPTSVQLALPKFKFDAEFDLGDQLATLGMPDAFDPDQANFSGMTEKNDLYISNVLHKAFVAIDEQGTEAAAATAVFVAAMGAPMPDTALTIDRPFIFVIRDIPTGQILFIGRVHYPVP